ncbi:MAG: RNA polymerase sigma factor [Allomuricauda sp.]
MLTNKEYDLVKKIRDGNTHAFSVLVDRYKNLVYTLAYRMLQNREEAEEVSQDSFIKVFNSLKQFKGDSKISTWIYRITYNTCLDRIKQNRKNHMFVDAENLEDFAFVEMNNALDKMVAEERSHLFGECLAKLPAKDSGLLTLFYFEGKSLLELEKILDIPVNSIKVWLFRARKKMAEVLEGNLKQEILENNG